MNEFHFLRPAILYLFFPLIGLILFFFLKKPQMSIWEKICSKDLLPYIITGKTKQRFLPSLLLFFLGTLMILALAGPAWQMIPQPLFKTQSSIVIALDLSPSMNAEDIKPSRLQRALYKINDLLDMHKEGQTALIVFSSEPFVVTPMTDDTATIKALLPVLNTKIMPVTGHRADKAIQKASELLKQSGAPQGSILLVTTELSKQEIEKSIEIANKNQIAISVLGIGTEEGAPIPHAEGGFVKDEKGALLISKLNPGNLAQFVAATQGTYATISIDDSDLASFRKSISANPVKENEQQEVMKNKWHDQGYLLVLATLPLLLLFFRRGMLIVACLIFPHAIHAFSWEDLWKTPDQQAQQLFHKEDYQQAKERFQNPEWQASSCYKLGEYQEAAELFQKNHSADGLYNFGTAKAKGGDLEAALDAYNQVLEMQPDHEDALHNKKLIEEFKKQQQNQQDQNQKNQSDQKQQDQNKQNQNDNQKENEQNQSNQNQQNGDQKEQQQSKQNQQDEDQKQNSDQQQNKDSQDQNKENVSQQDKEKQNKTSEKPSETSPQETQKQSEERQKQYKDNVEKELQESKQKDSSQKIQDIEEESEENLQKQVDEKILQRIKDDPGGLLRRKFLQQQWQREQD